MNYTWICPAGYIFEARQAYETYEPVVCPCCGQEAKKLHDYTPNPFKPLPEKYESKDKFYL